MSNTNFCKMETMQSLDNSYGYPNATMNLTLSIFPGNPCGLSSVCTRHTDLATL